MEVFQSLAFDAEFSQLNPALFTMDNYYHPIEEQQLDANGIVNFDLPTALNEAQLTSDLRTLVSGKPIEVKEYFFNTTPVKNVLLTIQPSELVLVEGLFLYHYQAVHSMLDYSVFVDFHFTFHLFNANFSPPSKWKTVLQNAIDWRREKSQKPHSGNGRSERNARLPIRRLY